MAANPALTTSFGFNPSAPPKQPSKQQPNLGVKLIQPKSRSLLPLARTAAEKAIQASQAAMRAVQAAEEQQQEIMALPLTKGGRKKQTKSKKRSKKYIKRRHTKYRKH